MTPLAFWSLLPILFGLLGGDGPSDRVRRLMVEDEVILKVPVAPRPLSGNIDWVEQKGPKCIPASEIRSAVLSGSEQVDFIMEGHQRVRAKFDEDCPALDFYSGFYLQPQDERICAGRDAIHSRVGGSCRIERLKRLDAKLKR